eukprot:c20635_g2_i3.p1 GENE.c20635_g2_i3~~c20635_g2_i3.p1  ORF type:complete len:148 (+),score=16.79 c20635_g2_i3:503-946(+)
MQSIMGAIQPSALFYRQCSPQVPAKPTCRAFLPTKRDMFPSDDGRGPGLSIDDAALTSARDSYDRRPASIGSFSITQETISSLSSEEPGIFSVCSAPEQGNPAHCLLQGWVACPASLSNKQWDLQNVLRNGGVAKELFLASRKFWPK